MSFLRITNPDLSNDFLIADLGYAVAANTTEVLSDQFSVNDLYLSADLESAIIAGDLDVEIDYGTGFVSIAGASWTNRDALATFMNILELTNENNNEKLINGSEVNAAATGGIGGNTAGQPLHIHDARYYTKSQINSTTNGSSGASLVGTYASGWTYVTGANVQAALDSIDALFVSGVTLDNAYDNDSDGILDVDGSGKDLNFRSDDSNDIAISRWDTTDSQDFLRAVVGASPELALGAAAVGALGQIDVHILTNLVVDGNLTFTGTITDTTVNELNVTNASILLRDGAATGANANIYVERGSTGDDASILWDEAADRWKAGLAAAEQTIALLEANEVVTGIWEFQGPGASSPNEYFTNKASAPSANLGTSTQIPLAVIANLPAYYDKTNSRNKFLSYQREYMTFVGRDHQNNSNEYARVADFTSNQSSYRLMQNSTLVGMSIQTNGNETWTARVRKNGVVTNLASLAASGVAGAQDMTLNVDFSAGDKVEVYIDGTSVDRPVIRLQFAVRF